MNILVTGSGQGIGCGYVKAYLELGYNVFASSRGQMSDDLKQLKEKYKEKLSYISLDVTDTNDIKKLKTELKDTPIDILINNAGLNLEGNQPKSFAGCNLDIILPMLNVNIVGVTRVTQALLENLNLSNNPKVINMSSGLGSITTTEQGRAYAYRISKAGLNMFTKCFAAEHPDIVCISIRPGMVKTQMALPQANLTVDESVALMVKVISGVSHKDSGKFLGNHGEEMPW